MPFNIKLNKFEKLLEELPKYPSTWKLHDVKTWLKLIGMEMYTNNFEEMSVDGLLILDLTEEDLEDEIGITVKLHRRKLVKAIMILNEYSIYLNDLEINPQKINRNTASETLRQGELLPALNNEERASFQSRDQERKTDLNRNEVDRVDEQYTNFTTRNNTKSFEDKNKKKEIGKEIILKKLEGPSESDYVIDSKGLKIGRHSSNKMALFDESVSRYHAEIIYKNDKFFLIDTGSTTGTFTRIEEPLTLKPGMIVEVGSYQLYVSDIFINPFRDNNNNICESFVRFLIHEAPEIIEDGEFVLYNNNSIGRKMTNTLSFTDDLHMSNLHCKVYCVGNDFILEDIASTNGTWLRLSGEGDKSSPLCLRNGTVFKIGNSAMFEVIEKKEEEVKNISESEIVMFNNSDIQNYCLICMQKERNCLIMPCRHNAICVDCGNEIERCPLCEAEISEIMRMFKA